MKLIGISGTNGSGKDTVGKMLSERHGWLFVSISDILRNILGRRGVLTEREAMRKLSAELRMEEGLGVLVDMAVERFKTSGEKCGGLAIASLRNPGEADKIHHLGGVVVWVDGNPKVRYQRTLSRNRAVEDQKTYEQFLSDEEAEMHFGKHEHTLSLAEVKKKGDIFIENNGYDIEVFKDQVEQALKKVYSL